MIVDLSHLAVPLPVAIRRKNITLQNAGLWPEAPVAVTQHSVAFGGEAEVPSRARNDAIDPEPRLAASLLCSAALAAWARHLQADEQACKWER